MTTPVRVLVVEDSITARKYLCDVLSGDPSIRVVGEARDGREAITMCRELRPDLLTMDIMLPVLSGLAATEFIMAHYPTPILVVSAATNRGEMFKTYEALAAGAVDVLEKPLGDQYDAVWEQELVSKAKTVARIRVITHVRGSLRPNRKFTPPAPPQHAARGLQVIGIGASTGGPGAIVEILRGLPDSFMLPLLLVIHISEPFGTAFAEWLDGQTQRRVTYAEQGMAVAAAAGKVIMAPPNRHMRVQRGMVTLDDEKERHSCRPSVDVLFESLAGEYGSATAACLLTGMGRDGAAGLLSIRLAGGRTIAQDEASSVVYGMPREAVEIGAVEEVLALKDIAPALVSLGQRNGIAL
jgi:two-component system, chemotaxis family, protein-glutamate methylesterase/glutaminase